MKVNSPHQNIFKIRFRTVSVLFFLTFTTITFARQPGDSTFIIETNQIKPVFDDNLDSLLNLYYVRNSPAIEDLVNDTSLRDLIYSNIPDSVYINRLAKIPSVFKLTYNPIVRQYIEMYTQRKRDRVQVMLGLAEYYFPMFDDIFDSYGVPVELKYMSIIESALNPRARSRTRAIGIWQFMYGTGKRYGLNVNSLVDERRDPIKETHAAAQYSKELYDIFGDWQLVVAAYNCGPANVNKAIRRSGGKKNYWDIYRYLPRETRGHVPAFIAAAYVMTYYKEHNLTPVPVSMPLRTDTIMVNHELHLMQVSDVLKIPIAQLRDLNPQYLMDIIPARNGQSFPLTLPLEYVTKFIDKQDSILKYRDSIYFNQKELFKSPNYASFKGNTTKPSGNFALVYYTVKSGESLGIISEWFDCRINDLMDWNDIYNYRIRAGQKLQIYVPRKSASFYEQFNNASFDEKQKLKGKASALVSKPATKVTSQTLDNTSNFVYYIVKQGDTIWDIAKQYPGISGEDICKWNNLTENSFIIPGQKIKIKVM
jgi:membrane-bound lytic murein transglycosylase D